MFPMMLYRILEDGKALTFLGEANDRDTKIVNSMTELETALDAGWLCHPLMSEHDKQIKELRAQIEATKKPKADVKATKKPKA